MFYVDVKKVEQKEAWEKIQSFNASKSKGGKTGRNAYRYDTIDSLE